MDQVPSKGHPMTPAETTFALGLSVGSLHIASAETLRAVKALATAMEAMTLGQENKVSQDAMEIYRNAIGKAEGQSEEAWRQLTSIMNKLMGSDA
jgi:hypothetical protein